MDVEEFSNSSVYETRSSFAKRCVEDDAPYFRTCAGHDQQLECLGDADPQVAAVICVDSVTGICTLLESALHHRTAMGSRGLLVGLICEKTSATIRPVIAWSDDSPLEDEDDLPRVHATTFGSRSFDLSIPVDVVKLALFCRPSKKFHSWTLPDTSRVLSYPRWRADIRPRFDSQDELDSQDDLDDGSEERVRSDRVTKVCHEHHMRPYFYARRVIVTSIWKGIIALPAIYIFATALVHFTSDMVCHYRRCNERDRAHAYYS
ncbi:hypothetical protein C8T65DRAFT_152648 [Cerioporus squamosus]|nr:hypothetical protein C8T65DRAFT_152648 [Cerioporus squamosus]